ncbi:hypothetical protein KKF34_00190 [Myxococcota bacterium]|nr:hypothetical protein [Myxococcota bacterium]MBU1379561.1 hypothetical protein [Myxococcota bacterium]MBU1495279.1 hypothetical protein [Myxococcota bacterium]
MKALKLNGENLTRHLNNLSNCVNIGLSNRYPDPEKLSNTLKLLTYQLESPKGVHFDPVSQMPTEAEITRLSNTKTIIEEHYHNHTAPDVWENDSFIDNLKSFSIVSRFDIKTKLLKEDGGYWTVNIVLDRWAINRNVYTRYSLVMKVSLNTYYFQDINNGCFPTDNLVNIVSSACRFDSETTFLALCGNKDLSVYFVSRGEIGPYITKDLSNLSTKIADFAPFLMFPLDMCSPEISGRIGNDFLQKQFFSDISEDMKQIFEEERKSRKYGTFCETRIVPTTDVDYVFESEFKTEHPNVIIIRRI